MSIGGEGYGERDRTGEEGSAAAYGRGSTALTTRTRLPGGEGGGRPPSRPGRNVITVVGVVVLLIAAIAFANRSGDSGDGDKAGGKEGGGAQPTAPTGEKPVKKTDGRSRRGSPSPGRARRARRRTTRWRWVSTACSSPTERHEIVAAVFAPDRSPTHAGQDSTRPTRGLPQEDRPGRGRQRPEDGMTFVSRTSPSAPRSRLRQAQRRASTSGTRRCSAWPGEGSKNPVTERLVHHAPSS